MTLTKKQRDHFKDIIKANKWFTYQEAEQEIRKSWKSNNKDEDYLLMQRKQIQRIIRSDIIGTYLEIDVRRSNTTDDEWLNQKIYGWTKEETYYLDLANGEETEYTEELHVFPKYDFLFGNSKLTQSIVLSSLDDELDDEDKAQLREIYEEMYHKNGFPGKGKTKYLMTEAYLFALKHEVERRQFPTKTLYLNPSSPEEILSALDVPELKDNVLEIIDTLLHQFTKQTDEAIKIHLLAKHKEVERFNEIFRFIRTWSTIYPKVININKLARDDLFNELKSEFSQLSRPFPYKIDSTKEKEKLHLKYAAEKITDLSSASLKNKIKNSIYSFENYSLTNLELALTADNALIGQAAQIRHKFSHHLYESLEKNHADQIIIDAINDCGIHDI